MSELTRFDIRVQEIGKKYCPDYPNIRNEEIFGYLWAIEQTLKGVNLANQDLHSIIGKQQTKINKLEKVVEAAIEVRKQKPNVYASTNETEAHQTLESLYEALAELNNEK